ncbi:MAG: glycerate kinase [Alphaproteobacteria bacterium]|nr:glycerate kinase [Alphaproteobacteria bacterium]
MDRDTAFAQLRTMFDAAIAAASPQVCLTPHLTALSRPRGRTLVIGAGKAAAAMAKAVEDNWAGPLSGLVVTRDGYELPTSRIECVAAKHPVPDERGRAAGGRMLEMVRGLSADDLVIALISGGGSALLTAPAPGLSLADKQAVNRALLSSGAPIGEMNVVRKHLSAIKGGRLALAARPARIVTYLISDVPGDDPGVIASGPTVADASTFADALTVLAKYRIDPPQAVRAHLEAGAAGRVEETPKPGDPRLSHASTVMTVTPMRALEAVADMARREGYEPMILGDAIEGLARDVARDHARRIHDLAGAGRRVALISGGETTVEVRGKGRGGRNVEYLLALALELDGMPGVWSLAGDTDGVDGIEDIAGARIAPDTLARAKTAGLDARARLEDNDGHGFFEALDDQIVTGPTRTNVNDCRISLIEG